MNLETLDPVCGMTVDPSRAAGRSAFQQTEYLFCSSWCLEQFRSSPKNYLQPKPRNDLVATTYFCPMHPEVMQEEPGNCPICGMALQTFSGEGGEKEARDMTIRFVGSVAILIPLLVIAMVRMHWAWAQLILATPIVFVAGWPLLELAWKSLRPFRPNMFTLIGMGVLAAYAYSAIATIKHGPLYFESAAMIVTLTLLGQLIELRMRGKTGEAIRSLVKQSPKTARRFDSNGAISELPLHVIQRGDRLLVSAGEKIPLDGTVLEGISEVDESLATGESLPATKKPGDIVLGGTLNGNGSLIIRADRLGSQSFVAEVFRLISEVQHSKAPAQRLADRVSSYFVPAVMATSVLVFIVWYLAGPLPSLANALTNSVAVLIVACPCALGLATPMSIQVAAGRAASIGILIRDAAALETLSRCDLLIVDKTGTLTEGRPTVTSLSNHSGEAETTIVSRAASLAAASDHPLSRAVVSYARDKEIAFVPVGSVESRPGEGLTASIDGAQWRLGSPAWLAQSGVQIPLETTVVLSKNSDVAALFTFSDSIKPSAAGAIRTLVGEGLKIVMLSGDRTQTTKRVAKTLGIAEYEAQLSPKDKAERVAAYRAQGKVVVMAGDGMNDAAALAEADVAIAMSNGSDLAAQSSGLILLHGDLAGIAKARTLSRAVLRNIRQNLFLAFAYNTLGIPIAAGVLYPWFGTLLTPAVAAAAMTMSSITVMANSLRLRR